MKPDKFSGATSVETFLIQFDTCAEYNRWGSRDKAAQLKCCLAGTAAQVLWDSGSGHNMRYNELVDKLRARYGSTGLHERFATELSCRRRKTNETLAELHADIRRLMALAHPGSAQTQLGEEIARDHFVTALADRDLELKVRDREPATLDEAFRIAVRAETHLHAYEVEREQP